MWDSHASLRPLLESCRFWSLGCGSDPQLLEKRWCLNRTIKVYDRSDRFMYMINMRERLISFFVELVGY